MDSFAKEQRTRCMSRIRSKNTTPELAVRASFTAMNIRYRLHVRELPGKPDLVMRKMKLAIFVNGCFWHQHYGCKRKSLPKTNTEYWHRKLIRNIDRQNENIDSLLQQGWHTAVIWECETKNSDELDIRIKEILRA